MIRASHAWKALFLPLVLALLPAQRLGGRELLCLSHDRGRVAVRRPLDGSLGICSYPEGDFGIRWPGIDGKEFLGECGVYLRFRAPGEPGVTVIGPDMLEPFFAAGDGLGEGCEGGRRYPHPGSDDDGDGSIDEDPIDGGDNDGDGYIDEDFAAIGSDMKVTRARDTATGVIVGQCSYTWSFGHVRDFVGFTTTIRCDRADRRAITGLDAAIYADFRIGDGGDPRRGRDDSHFFLDSETVRGRVRAYVTSDGQYHIALLPLGIEGPGGAERPLVAVCTESADSLWSGQPTITLIDDGRGAFDGDALRFEPAMTGDFRVTGKVGEGSVCLRQGEPFPGLGPGEAVRMDWALVFGKSLGALARNIGRAVETYVGVVDDRGVRHNWVVPARRATRIELDAVPALAWSQGQRQAAAAILLPPALEDEEIEWLRAMNGEFIEYQRAGGKLIVMVADPLADGEHVRLEGQLTDGTVFTAALDASILRGAEDDGESEDSLPEESIQLYPNPFLTSLNISLRILDPSTIAPGANGASSVKIYDVRGRLVKTVLDQELLHPGEYVRVWDGLDEHGKEAAPGVYYVKLQIGIRSVTKRVILLR